MASFVVGVTGGIASGKSAVTDLFAKLGVPVLDADVVAREVVAKGQPALHEIAARFGPGVVLADGALDRARLRSLVFSDSTAKRDLEAITHPRIRLLLHAQCLAAPGPYAVAAIPLLAESGAGEAYAWLSRVLVIDAPESIQTARLIRRDGGTPEQAERMIASQASRRKRLGIATDVLINDASVKELEGPVSRLDAVFRQLAQG